MKFLEGKPSWVEKKCLKKDTWGFELMQLMAFTLAYISGGLTFVLVYILVRMVRCWWSKRQGTAGWSAATEERGEGDSEPVLPSCGQVQCTRAPLCWTRTAAVSCQWTHPGCMDGNEFFSLFIWNWYIRWINRSPPSRGLSLFRYMI